MKPPDKPASRLPGSIRLKVFGVHDWISKTMYKRDNGTNIQYEVTSSRMRCVLPNNSIVIRHTTAYMVAATTRFTDCDETTTAAEAAAADEAAAAVACATLAALVPTDLGVDDAGHPSLLCSMDLDALRNGCMKTHLEGKLLQLFQPEHLQVDNSCAQAMLYTRRLRQEKPLGKAVDAQLGGAPTTTTFSAADANAVCATYDCCSYDL